MHHYCKTAACAIMLASLLLLNSCALPANNKKNELENSSECVSGQTENSADHAALFPTQAWIDRMLQLTNQEREKAKLTPFVLSDSLCAAAAVRADEIELQFSHTRPSGEVCFSVLIQQNIAYSAAAENIAAGQSSPQEALTAWMHSAGHRANILNPSLTKLGIGIQTGGEYGFYWVQVFTD